MNALGLSASIEDSTSLMTLPRDGYETSDSRTPEEGILGSCHAAAASAINLLEGAVEVLAEQFNPAWFREHIGQRRLQEVFINSSYAGYKSYSDALIALRKKISRELKSGGISQESQGLSYAVMMQSGLPDGCRYGSQYLFQNEKQNKMSLAELFEEDRKSIKEQSSEAGEGIFHKGVGKLGAELGVRFDPLRKGNFPFLLGHFEVEGRSVNILRYPVPVVEKMGQMHIAEEYVAFLESCRSKGEKVLYTSLLNPEHPVEQKRMEALQGLGKEYSDVFHFVRMPLDGPFLKAALDEKISLEEYKGLLQKDLEKAMQGVLELKVDPHEFIFGSISVAGVVSDYGDRIIDAAYAFVQEGEGLSEKEKKQAFMMLYCSLLRLVLIKELGINHYNNTCKDAIDRGAAHLVADLVLNSFLNGKLHDEKNQFYMRLAAAWPAFMAKTQAILSDRADWAIALTKWAESVELKMDLDARWLKRRKAQDTAPWKQLNVQVGPISYENPSILSQTKEEIQGICSRHKGGKKINMCIPITRKESMDEYDFRFEDVPLQILAKVMDRMNREYGLLFTRAEESLPPPLQSTEKLFLEWDLEAKATDTNEKEAYLKVHVEFLDQGNQDELSLQVSSQIELPSYHEYVLIDFEADEDGV